MNSFRDIHVANDSVKVDISFADLAKRIDEAQKWLDTKVFEDTEPFIPMDTGATTENARAANIGTEGTGLVNIGKSDYVKHIWNGINERTGGPLHYQTTHHPFATHHWFNASLEANHDKWVEGVRNIIYGR